MTDFQGFDGYPIEAHRFYVELEQNNDREWFNTNKQTYLDAVVAPTKALVETLGLRLQAISPDIIFDTRTNGAGSMMRIYRDTRFSKDKTPYKTWLGVVFWEGPRKKAENPSFYFHMDSSGAGMYTGMHGFPKEFITPYRDAIVDDTLGPEFEQALKTIAAAGDYSIYQEPEYKRVPRGYDLDHPRAEWLKYKGFGVVSPHISPEQLSGPDLIDICYRHCVNLAPIHRWLVKVAGSAR